MTTENIFIFLFVTVPSLWFMFALWKRGNIAGSLVVGSFVVRAASALVLETGLKFMFVWDSIPYERTAWHLAKFWNSSQAIDYLSPEGMSDLNLYEILLAGIFFLFGQNSFVAALVNSLLGSLTVGLVYLIYTRFLSDPKNPIKTELVGRLCIVILGLYPSFVVWSSTNIRDPLYYFFGTLLFFFLLQTFSKRSSWYFPARVLGVVISVLCFLTILGIRNYIGWVFLLGLGVGVLFALLATTFRPQRVLLIGSLITIPLVYLYASAFPKDIEEIITYLQKQRGAFANLGMDDYAASSFQLDYVFSSLFDVLAFIPTGLAYYFLAPFPWQVTSFVQALAMIEVLTIYALIYPTYVGITTAFSKARFETSILVSFSIVMAMLQSVVISNMGTIFRHRTLGFIFLSIFAGIGVYEIWKKNSSNFLKA